MSTAKLETQPTKGVRVCTWTALAEDEDGDAFFCGDLDRLTFQATGTFANEAVTLEGSMDGTNWFGLQDEEGAAISLSAAGLSSVLERPLWVRPSVGTGGGVGTPDVDAIVSGVDLQ